MCSRAPKDFFQAQRDCEAELNLNNQSRTLPGKKNKTALIVLPDLCNFEFFLHGLLEK